MKTKNDENINVYEFAKKNNEDNMRATSIIFYNKKISFQELFDSIDNCSQNLHSIGVREDSIVTICLPNTPQQIIAFYAVNKINAICNIIHPLTPIESVIEGMKKIGSKVLITSDFVLLDKQIKDITVVYCKTNAMMGFIYKYGYELTNKTKFVRYDNYINFAKLIKGCKDTLNIMTYKKEAIDYSQKPCVYLHSGGTTGEPKTITISNGALNSLASKVNWYVNEKDPRTMVLYSVLPLFHGFGLGINTHTAISNGAKQILIAKFHANKAVKLIKKYKINMINAVPSLFNALIKCKSYKKGMLDSLSTCYVGGDVINEALIDSFNIEVGGSKENRILSAGYGLTEVIAVCTINNRKYYKRNSCGIAISGVQVEACKDGSVLNRGECGEICVAGDTVMLGYLEDNGKPAETEFFVNGVRWIKTGDYGYVDKDGYLFFIQRIKHIIVRKGVNVFPIEIERVVDSIPFVKKSCAVGYSLDDGTQIVRLFVKIDENTSKSKKEMSQEIRRVTSKNLILYSVPEQIVFIDKFPLTKVGKIETSKLLELCIDSSQIY